MLLGRDTPARFISSSMMIWWIGSASSPHGFGQCGATSPASASWRPVGAGFAVEPRPQLLSSRIVLSRQLEVHAGEVTRPLPRRRRRGGGPAERRRPASRGGADRLGDRGVGRRPALTDRRPPTTARTAASDRRPPSLTDRQRRTDDHRVRAHRRTDDRPSLTTAERRTDDHALTDRARTADRRSDAHRRPTTVATDRHVGRDRAPTGRRSAPVRRSTGQRRTSTSAPLSRVAVRRLRPTVVRHRRSVDRRSPTLDGPADTSTRRRPAMAAIDRMIEHIAREQHGAFNITQAPPPAATDAMIRSRVANGAWRREVRGVYTLAAFPRPGQAAQRGRAVEAGRARRRQGRRCAPRARRLRAVPTRSSSSRPATNHGARSPGSTSSRDDRATVVRRHPGHDGPADAHRRRRDRVAGEAPPGRRARRDRGHRRRRGPRRAVPRARTATGRTASARCVRSCSTRSATPGTSRRDPSSNAILYEVLGRSASTSSARRRCRGERRTR